MSKDYDPRMHSAEHILNQTMVRMFQCGRSFSAHIEKKKTKCDYHFERNLTAEEIAELSRRVNQVIRQDLPVHEDFLTRDEAAPLFALDRLPDQAGNAVRIIRIGDYDACPCIGQHVRSTRDIGTFQIVSTDHSAGILRIRFKLE